MYEGAGTKSEIKAFREFIEGAPMGVHADGGLEKAIFLISIKNKSGPNLGVLARKTDSSRDLAAYRPKIIQKDALAATFWAKRQF